MCVPIKPNKPTFGKRLKAKKMEGGGGGWVERGGKAFVLLFFLLKNG
jgi:hypothetical protein